MRKVRWLPIAFLLLCMVALSTDRVAGAADWTQWRGPQRNGLLPDSPPLLESFPEGKPVRLWESEEMHRGGRGGWGSVVVADGRAYAFADWGYNVPKDERVIEKGHLNGHGYVADMPAQLLEKIEQARTSEERKNLKDRKKIETWVNEWLKANITEDDKKFRGAAQARLRAGEKAVALDLLAKMATVVDKPFPNQEAMDQWFRQNGIDEATQKVAAKRVSRTRPESRDFVACFDAATGKLLWKTEVKSKDAGTYSDSCTPAVANGRVYVLTAASFISCLDAKTGGVVWEKQPFEKPSDAHSSLVVADGVVVASARTTVGVNAETGEVMWEVKKARAANPSPALWKQGDRTRVIINSRSLTCLDPKTGEVVWEQRGGGDSATPTVVGDYLALIRGQKLAAYKLAADKAEMLWEVPFPDDYASALIYEDHVYAVGATPRGQKKGKAVCVELKTGKVAWEAVVEGGPTCSSPLVADGKLVAFAGGTLALIKASPQKYELLGQAKIDCDGYTSPTITDGKLFFRARNRVYCYDLGK